MYLRNDEGDPGYSTRNPDYTGPEDAKIEYRLENGQVDEYPVGVEHYDTGSTARISTFLHKPRTGTMARLARRLNLLFSRPRNRENPSFEPQRASGRADEASNAFA